MNVKARLNQAREAINNGSIKATTAVGATLMTGTAAASGGGGGGGTTIPGSDGAASDAFSQIQSAGAEMITNAWPVLIAITGGFILMKLGKRAMNKAT